MQQKDINITVIINDDQFVLQTYAREYRNVMALIRDNLYPEDFGECGGQGRCCTCLVKVMNKDIELPVPDGNEAATLAKHHVTDPNIRLSCHLMPEKNMNNLILKVETL